MGGITSGGEVEARKERGAEEAGSGERRSGRTARPEVSPHLKVKRGA